MIAIPVEPPITEYLHAKAARQGIPLSGTFELTPLCNMNCRMCYVRMSRGAQEATAPCARLPNGWSWAGRLRSRDFCTSSSQEGSPSSARISGKSWQACTKWACSFPSIPMEL